jgi:serine protease AprX
MRFIGRRWCAAALFLALSAWPGTAGRLHAAPSKSKLDSALQTPPTGLVRVIVTTSPGQRDAVAFRLMLRGRWPKDRYSVIDALVVNVSADDLAMLAADPRVISVSIDATVKSATTGTWSSFFSSAFSQATLLPTLGLPIQGLTGNGVGVAVIDSGLLQNGDFSGVTFYDFTNSLIRTSYDDYGHGTHVSGLIASKGSVSQGGYTGIAPRARLISLKVLDANGQGSTSTVIDAIEFAVLNRKYLGVDVINLSLGHPIFEHAATDPLVQAVEAAVRAGIVVVASAGNVGRSLTTGLPGYAGILSPGNAPSAITVGALDTHGTTTRGDDTIPSYSSRGPTWYDALPKPDFVAPGQALVSDAAIGSTLYTSFPGAWVMGTGGVARFLRLGGTSMSAAVTSGVVALMIEASRNVSGASPPPQAIKAVLDYTALPLNGPDSLTQGHGAINPPGAVALTQALAAAGWPAGEIVTPITPATTIAGETWVWAQAFDDGDTVVWGNDGGEPAWATTVVWGNIDWGDTVVWGNADTIDWGDTVVWGNTDGWGDTVVWGNTNGLR